MPPHSAVCPTPDSIHHFDFPLSITRSPALCTPFSITPPPSHHWATLSFIILTPQTQPLSTFSILVISHLSAT